MSHGSDVKVDRKTAGQSTARIRRRRLNTIPGDQVSNPSAPQSHQPSTLPDKLSDTVLSELQSGSDAVPPSCQPCAIQKKDNESEAYCVDCKEFLCTSCSRRHAGHQLLTGPDVPGSVRAAAKQRTTEQRCNQHQDKTVKRYCVDHDYLCCGECLQTEHYSCSLQELDDMIAKANAEKLKENTVGLLQSQIKSFANVREQMNSRKHFLITENDKQADEIRRFTAELVATLYRLEKESLEELKAQVDTEVRTIENGLLECKQCMKGICEDIRLISEPRQDTKENKILNTKACQIRAKSKYGITLKKLFTEQHSDDGIEFVPDPRIVEFIATGRSLGMTRSRNRKGAALHLVSRHSTKLQDDPMPKTCVTSIDVLADGTLVLADEGNEKIKLFDDSFNILDSKALTSAPRCLSVNKFLKGVVTLPQEGSVQLFSIDDHGFVILQKLFLGLEFTGAVTTQDSMFLCCYGQNDYPVIQVDFKGNVAKKYCLGANECMMPNYMHLDGSSNTLYVSDAKQGIYCIELSQGPTGVWHYTSPDMACLLGLTTDHVGRMLVADYTASAIYRVPRGGRHECLTRDQKGADIQHPQSLCFLPKHKEFLLSHERDYEIFRYRVDD